MNRLNKNGFTLIEMMIAMALSAFVMIGSSYLINHTFAVQKNEDQMFWLEQRRSEMVSAIQNDENWTELSAQNPNMRCAVVSTGCSVYALPQKLKLKLNSGFILDGTNSALGINKKVTFVISLAQQGDIVIVQSELV